MSVIFPSPLLYFHLSLLSLIAGRHLLDARGVGSIKLKQAHILKAYWYSLKVRDKTQGPTEAEVIHTLHGQSAMESVSGEQKRTDGIPTVSWASGMIWLCSTSSSSFQHL
jgi:hypothetical protein